MTREQAINSMISHGFTVEQAGEIIKAVTPQLSSELEKNSKKLEKGTAKNDLTEQCIACKYDETEDENGEHCKKCLEGGSQFELDEALAKPSTKNDLGVDCVSRQAISGYIDYILSHGMGKNKSFGFIKKFVDKLPSVTPQEPQIFKWCANCKEYDQEKHCCHRWSKVIRDTVEEMKQEYIEREVLDKIRAEIEQKLGTHGNISLYNRAIYDVLMIIDRYKAESEVDNGND